MVYRIQSGLRMLTEQFCREVTTTRAGRELIFQRDGPSPQVKMSYEYLMAWFTLYCPVLIQPGEEVPESEYCAHLRRFENSQWVGKYLAGVRRLVESQDSYSLFRCFFLILGTEEFRNVGDERTLLEEGTFKWLVNIRPSPLVYQYRDDCYLEPICPAASPGNLVMTNCMLITPTLGSGIWEV